MTVTRWRGDWWPSPFDHFIFFHLKSCYVLCVSCSLLYWLLHWRETISFDTHTWQTSIWHSGLMDFDVVVSHLFLFYFWRCYGGNLNKKMSYVLNQLVWCFGLIHISLHHHQPQSWFRYRMWVKLDLIYLLHSSLHLVHVTHFDMFSLLF